MSELEHLLCEELQIIEEVLDVYVLQPDALSQAERYHIASRIRENAVLREYVRELRAFYEELRAEGELPEHVSAFIKKLCGE